MKKLLPAFVSLLVACALPLDAQANERIVACRELKEGVAYTWAMKADKNASRVILSRRYEQQKARVIPTTMMWADEAWQFVIVYALSKWHFGQDKLGEKLSEAFPLSVYWVDFARPSMTIYEISSIRVDDAPTKLTNCARLD